MSDKTKAKVKPAEPTKPQETKREKFLRLARRRVPKAAKAIEQVANLFRRTMYDSSEAHLAGTVALLQKALDQCEVNFHGAQPKTPINLPFLADTAPPSNGPAQ